MTDTSDLSERAQQGDPVAQYELGVLSRRGANGAPPNLPAAMQWLFKSASQNHVPAQLALGLLLLDDLSSIGAKRNPLQAALWLEKAAAAGEALAQHRLGMQLLEYAVAGGQDDALYNLGLLRLSAPAVKDLVEADKWGTFAVKHDPAGGGVKLLEVLAGLCSPQRWKKAARAASWQRVPRGLTVMKVGEAVKPVDRMQFTFEAKP